MGGRGGGGKNPYGEAGKLYMFTVDTYKNGIKVGTGEVLANGGSNPVWFTKEVGSGVIPSINWFHNGKNTNFSFYQGQYVWVVTTSRISYSTTNSLDDYNLEYRVANIKEYPNPNNHPVIVIN